MTRSSDLVMVERGVLERAHGHLCKIAGTEAWTHNNLDGWQVTPGALREYAESAAKELDRALQSVEGGVQGSIADGQQCNEQSGQSLSPAFGIIDPDYARIFTIARCLAWAEGYAIAMHGSFTRDLDLIAVPWAPHACEPEHLAKRIESAAGLKITAPPKNDKPHNRLVWTMTLPEFGDPRFVDLSIIPPQHEVELSEEDVRMIDQAWETHKAALPLTAEALAEEIHIQMSVKKTCVVSGANALAKALLEKFTITQLTKTPSADHDAGNLRSLAEPNHHQPHAVSQALRAYQALFEPPESDAYDNLTGALYDIKRHTEAGKPTDEVCIRTIERVLDQIATAYTALRSGLDTHLPAPPSPENTPRDSSESTTGGAS